MISLEFGGMAAALPVDFSFSLTVENPYFTDSGEYSGEVTLSAKSPENIKIFGICNRFEKSRKKITKTFVLKDGSTTIMSGTAVSVAYDEENITVQLLGGNSEINFLSRYDKVYIDELKTEMGKIIDSWDVIFDLNYHDGSFANYVMASPSEREFVMLPAVSSDGQEVNNGGLWFVGSIQTPRQFGHPKQPTRGNTYQYALQPRLCAIVRKVLQAMGYSVRTFDAESTHLKYLYYVNVQNTLYWSEMMPHWSINQFMTEIQNLFGCVFVFDTINKICDIKARANFFTSDIKYLNKVDDSFGAEISDDYTDIGNALLQYNTDEISTKHLFDPSVLENIKYEERPTRYLAEQLLHYGVPNMVVSVDGHWLIRHDELDEEGNSTGEKSIEEVNDIGCKYTTETEDVVSLNIIPAKMSFVKANVWSLHENGGLATAYGWWLIPSPIGVYPNKSEVFNVDTYSYSGESSYKENELQQMRVAFFTSYDKMPTYDKIYVWGYPGTTQGPLKYPSPAAATMRLFCGWTYPKDDISIDHEINGPTYSFQSRIVNTCGWDCYTDYMQWNPNCALRAKSNEDTIYSGGIQSAKSIDTTTPHTFDFYDDINLSDINKTYVIRGHKYACKSMELQIKSDGISKVKKGTFYRID